jgi:hypothetical protein
VEKILEEYVEDDDELREKLYDLRINVESNKKISNVVEENERLKEELEEVLKEVGRLRKQLLKIETIDENQQKQHEDLEYKDLQALHTEIHAHSGENDIIEEEKIEYEGEEDEK